MTKCSFQYSVRTCTRRAQSFGLKECQLAFTEQRTTDIYMKIPPFDSLVWVRSGSPQLEQWASYRGSRQILSSGVR